MKLINFRTILIVVILLCVVIIGGTLEDGTLAQFLRQGGAPTVVSYQGQVTVADAPFDGEGYFKFAVVDADGTSSYWSNDGTSSGGSEPTTAVSLTVTNGLFTVLLGDTNLSGMTAAMDAAVFDDIDRNLRVWFSDDNSTFSQLSPDTKIAAVPYALQAEEAKNAANLAGQPASDYQARVDGECAIGSSIRVINADGSVMCDAPVTDYYPLLQAQSVDMATVYSGLRGFKGGFTDGRYAYIVPSYNTITHGNLARVDLQTFDASSVTWLDLKTIDSHLSAFQGGFTDGRYGYLVPHGYPGVRNGKFTRVDLQNFTTGGVTVIDLATIDSQLKVFEGGFTDGRYAYLVPSESYGVEHSKAVRVDLQNFTTTGVTILDLATNDASLKRFSGGFTDGLYAYFVQGYTHAGIKGKLVRVALPDFTPASIEVLDLEAINPDLVNYSSGFTVGRYAYLFAANDMVTRVDLQKFDAIGVAWVDLGNVDSDLGSYRGGFSDGRYAYFVPHSTSNGKIPRIDLNNFTEDGVSWLDLATIDPELVGFQGGFSDGRFGYLVPRYNNSGGFGGKVARIPLFNGSGVP